MGYYVKDGRTILVLDTEQINAVTNLLFASRARSMYEVHVAQLRATLQTQEALLDTKRIEEGDALSAALAVVHETTLVEAQSSVSVLLTKEYRFRLVSMRLLDAENDHDMLTANEYNFEVGILGPDNVHVGQVIDFSEPARIKEDRWRPHWLDLPAAQSLNSIARRVMQGGEIGIRLEDRWFLGVFVLEAPTRDEEVKDGDSDGDGDGNV